RLAAGAVGTHRRRGLPAVPAAGGEGPGRCARTQDRPRVLRVRRCAVSAVQTAATAFVEQRTKVPVARDVDLFADGLVSSLFALELVVFLESRFGVTVGGADLKLDNFRTVD